MNILISIEHPAHVHFFKNFIWALENEHKIILVAFEKDLTIDLLNKYGFKFINLKGYGHSIIAKGLKMPLMTYKIARIAFKNKIDILMGVSIFAAQAAFFTRKKSYIFTDTEHAKEQIALFKPFATKIYTPSCFLKDLGKKQIRYDGYHEMAYLHTNRFKPNPHVLKELGINENDKFFIVRFVSWEASHDIGQKGLSLENKKKLIEMLSPHGRVIISSEKTLPEYFEPYRMIVSPTKMHDLLYFATMYIGESGTTATEASLLGTPSILINTLAKYCGNHLDLQKKEIQFFFDNLESALPTIKVYLDKEMKEKFRLKVKYFMKEKIDVTDYLIKLFKND
jgi:uncharacterized protein